VPRNILSAGVETPGWEGRQNGGPLLAGGLRTRPKVLTSGGEALAARRKDWRFAFRAMAAVRGEKARVPRPVRA